MDEVGLAAALLGVRGKTIYANDHMASLIPAVVQDRHDRFTIIDKRADSLLSGLLAEISSTGSLTRIGSIPIEAASDQPPSVLHLIPVRGVVRDIFSTAKLIAVITPLMQKIMPDASILQGLFDLTPSEAKVAKGLGDGMTIDQISQIMNIKSSTCRFYMKRVITKTGTGRQAVLAGLLQNIAPPFR
ncbi:helix-turn-helix transcriptional regulator [Hoeflea sp. G2-23]|uniref:Helix-turn-helix transcriptional regulator n=1 Tax=Hoeflea algicola TaxID=2983763 RepID=A0ABT3Z4W2_9HYPH|nr:helix-turn-helix transcriptional regulator [Hoeflea algicola]MCY0146777.1 helix-turn-helix transcriptional regulator [Hoeflea algicola]